MTPVRPHFIKLHDGGSAFMHPCSVCGAANSPFGEHANLALAVQLRDSSRAGTWYCWEHWPARADADSCQPPVSAAEPAKVAA